MIWKRKRIGMWVGPPFFLSIEPHTSMSNPHVPASQGLAQGRTKGGTWGRSLFADWSTAPGTTYGPGRRPCTCASKLYTPITITRVNDDTTGRPSVRPCACLRAQKNDERARRQKTTWPTGTATTSTTPYTLLHNKKKEKKGKMSHLFLSSWHIGNQFHFHIWSHWSTHVEEICQAVCSSRCRLDPSHSSLLVLIRIRLHRDAQVVRRILLFFGIESTTDGEKLRRIERILLLLLLRLMWCLPLTAIRLQYSGVSVLCWAGSVSVICALPCLLFWTTPFLLTIRRWPLSGKEEERTATSTSSVVVDAPRLGCCHSSTCLLRHPCLFIFWRLALLLLLQEERGEDNLSYVPSGWYTLPFSMLIWSRAACHHCWRLFDMNMDISCLLLTWQNL